MGEAPSTPREAAPAPMSPTPMSTAEAPAAQPTPVRRARNRRAQVRLVLFLLLPLALLAGGWEYARGGRIMSTDNAYVRADILPVSTDISGIVKEVPVRENQPIRIGDVLFRLDDQPFRIALDRAEAQIGVVRTALEALKASYKDMQAQIAQAQVDVNFYARELDRQKELLARSVASQAAFDQAQRNLLSARQKVASLQQQLAGIVANLGGDPDLPVEQHPRYAEAVAARDEAARQLSHTTVVAPMNGVATNVPSLRPGMYLAAATPAFSIVSTDHLWIDASPKETELTNVRPGQKVTVTVDTYPDESWKGVVDSVSPASASSYAILPAQNTSGNWVKVVQRIPMRVRIETQPDQPPLRAGMSVVVNVDTGKARGLPSFLAPVAEWVGLAPAGQKG